MEGGRGGREGREGGRMEGDAEESVRRRGGRREEMKIF